MGCHQIDVHIIARKKQYDCRAEKPFKKAEVCPPYFQNQCRQQTQDTQIAQHDHSAQGGHTKPADIYNHAQNRGNKQQTGFRGDNGTYRA